MNSKMLMLIVMGVFLSQQVMGNRLLSQELEAPKSSICDNGKHYWLEQFINSPFSGDICKFNFENNVWTYDGINTCVGSGKFDFPCDSSKYICAGKNNFGYGIAQAKKAIEAVNNGGVHPHCPIVIANDCIGTPEKISEDILDDDLKVQFNTNFCPQLIEHCEEVFGRVMKAGFIKNVGVTSKAQMNMVQAKLFIDNAPDTLLVQDVCKCHCGQGKINEEERKLIEQYMGLFDRDGDGMINVREITSKFFSNENRMKAFLKRFDLNYDGEVAKHELMIYFVNKKFRLGGDHKKFQQMLYNMIEKNKPENKEDGSDFQ